MGLKKLGGEIKKMNKNLFRRSVYGTNALRNKCIVAFLLAAALLISMVGMASASETWDLDSNRVMYAGTHTEIGSVDISAGGSQVWRSDAPAGGLYFPAETWNGRLNTAVLDYTVDIGYSNADGSGFTSNGVTGSHDFGKSYFHITADGFTVPPGKYAALKVTATSALAVTTEGGSSYVRYSGTPEGVTETPEFVTIAIPVAAILGLLFFFNRRKRK